MIKKILLIIIAASLVALSVAINWQAFTELREIGILAHLAAYSDHDHDGIDDHASDGDDDHHPVATTHTHKHRHSPNEPEHEHTHTNPGFVNTVVQASFPQASTFITLRMPPVLELRMSLSEGLPSSRELPSLFRPPIC